MNGVHGPYGQPFGITVTEDAARSRVVLTGELDINGIAALRAVLDGLRRDGRLDVAVDMGGLDFVDAAGLGLLAEAAGKFRDAGGRLVLVAVGPRHRRLLAITELDRFLTVE